MGMLFGDESIFFSMNKANLFMMMSCIGVFKMGYYIHFFDLKTRHLLNFTFDTAKNARKEHMKDTTASSRYEFR